MSDVPGLPEDCSELYKFPSLILDNYRLSSLLFYHPPFTSSYTLNMSFANLSVADVLGLNNRVGPAPGTFVCLRGLSSLFLIVGLIIFCRMTLIQRRFLSGTSI